MSSLDFGYPWWLSNGHLAILAPAAAALVAAWKWNWPRWALVSLGLLTAWAAAAFLVMRSFDVNGPPQLPTPNFLRGGEGRVLDIGAGTGRSSVMVLAQRPRATLVASDLFGDSFHHHFGHEGGSAEHRLMANLQAAGVANRATIQKADMRELPFPAASFEGIVSAYAMDHLNRDGSKKALVEAGRVLKPGGDFLLILVANDKFTRFAFGPLLSHGGTRGAAWWRDRLRETGFQVAEEGTLPASQWFLSRK